MRNTPLKAFTKTSAFKHSGKEMYPSNEKMAVKHDKMYGEGHSSDHVTLSTKRNMQRTIERQKELKKKAEKL